MTLFPFFSSLTISVNFLHIWRIPSYVFCGILSFHSYSLVHVISFSFFSVRFYVVADLQKWWWEKWISFDGILVRFNKKSVLQMFRALFFYWAVPISRSTALNSSSYRFSQGAQSSFFSAWKVTHVSCFISLIFFFLSPFHFEDWRRRRMLVLTMAHCLKVSFFSFFLVCLRERLELATASFLYMLFAFFWKVRRYLCIHRSKDFARLATGSLRIWSSRALKSQPHYGLFEKFIAVLTGLLMLR